MGQVIAPIRVDNTQNPVVSGQIIIPIPHNTTINPVTARAIPQITPIKVSFSTAQAPKASISGVILSTIAFNIGTNAFPNTSNKSP